MIGSNLTYDQWLDLFGKGMGLLTVGAAWLLVGVHGPFSGQLTIAFLALSVPFFAAGAGMTLLPALFPTQPVESSIQTGTGEQTLPPQSLDD